MRRTRAIYGLLVLVSAGTRLVLCLKPAQAGGLVMLSGNNVNRAPLLEPNHPYVFAVVLNDANDDGNSTHLYAQGLSPLIPVYLPLILK